LIGRGTSRDGLRVNHIAGTGRRLSPRAARVRQLAIEATTAAVKEHLREVALEYERLAERADNGTLPTGP